MRIIRFLFSIRGRADRGQFWLTVVLFNATVLLIAGITVVLAHAVGTSSLSLHLGVITVVIEGPKARLVGTPWIAVLLVPLAVRRLHDRNRSGGRLLAFVIAYLVLGLTAEIAEPIGTAATEAPAEPSVTAAVAAIVETVARLAAVAVAVWGFVEIACLAGTRGENDFGSDARTGEARPDIGPEVAGTPKEMPR